LVELRRLSKEKGAIASAQETLTLIADLNQNHTGAGATVTALGKLGFVKEIALQGDPVACSVICYRFLSC
jgi:hypothetical protein